MTEDEISDMVKSFERALTAILDAMKVIDKRLKVIEEAMKRRPR